MMGGIIHSSSAAAYLTTAEDEGLKGSKPKFFSFDEAPIVWEILLFANNLRLVYVRYVE
jgi:hypothetical protein